MIGSLRSQGRPENRPCNGRVAETNNKGNYFSRNAIVCYI
jgi:hypothetical protein